MLEIPDNVCHVVAKLINISSVIMLPNLIRTVMKPTLYLCNRMGNGQLCSAISSDQQSYKVLFKFNILMLIFWMHIVLFRRTKCTMGLRSFPSSVDFTIPFHWYWEGG